MDLKLEEQLLLADFRRLDSAGKKELLDYATFLLEKRSSVIAEEPAEQESQCRIGRPEERPETVKEPIFTE